MLLVWFNISEVKTCFGIEMSEHAGERGAAVGEKTRPEPRNSLVKARFPPGVSPRVSGMNKASAQTVITRCNEACVS